MVEGRCLRVARHVDLDEALARRSLAEVPEAVVLVEPVRFDVGELDVRGQVATQELLGMAIVGQPPLGEADRRQHAEQDGEEGARMAARRLHGFWHVSARSGVRAAITNNPSFCRHSRFRGNHDGVRPFPRMSGFPGAAKAQRKKAAATFARGGSGAPQ